jgi:hypothetical protein
MKPFYESPDERLEVIRRVLDPVAPEFSCYETLYAALWVCREWGDVEVEIKRFLEGREVKITVFSHNVEV